MTFNPQYIVTPRIVRQIVAIERNTGFPNTATLKWDCPGKETSESCYEYPHPVGRSGEPAEPTCKPRKTMAGRLSGCGLSSAGTGERWGLNRNRNYARYNHRH